MRARRAKLAFALAVLVVAAFAAPAAAADQGSAGPVVSVFASNLENPRGMTFGPDGNLYVAEGGVGGAMFTTSAQCDQVGVAGPYTGDFNARISKISPDGVRSTVVDSLPSSQANGAGKLVSGVADVKFLDGKLYGLEAAAGCSHGLAGTHNTLFRVDGNTTTDIVDLTAFQVANPVAQPNCCDFEPDGTWYSMVAAKGALYAVEPNHGEVDRITANGQISRVVDVSASQGHVVPTSISYHGNFYFGNLGTFPVEPGTEAIRKLTPSGQLQTVATGLTAVLGTAWDSRGRLYVLESMTDAGGPSEDVSELGSGKVIRIDPDGSRTTVVDGLSFPTAMTFGPDGALYVSNFGFAPAPLAVGQILRIELGG
jgi:sugar lactone lactonase YvrE